MSTGVAQSETPSFITIVSPYSSNKWSILNNQLRLETVQNKPCSRCLFWDRFTRVQPASASRLIYWCQDPHASTRLSHLPYGFDWRTIVPSVNSSFVLRGALECPCLTRSLCRISRVYQLPQGNYVHACEYDTQPTRWNLVNCFQEVARKNICSWVAILSALVDSVPEKLPDISVQKG